MKHQYSTYALIGILTIVGIVAVMGSLQSGDIDEVCNIDNSSIIRTNGVWNCTNNLLNGTCLNVTYKGGLAVECND